MGGAYREGGDVEGVGKGVVNREERDGCQNDGRKPPYAPTESPTVGCMEHPLSDYSRNSLADPSFRALSGRLSLTVRRHKFSKDSLFFAVRCAGEHTEKEETWKVPEKA